MPEKSWKVVLEWSEEDDLVQVSARHVHDEKNTFGDYGSSAVLCLATDAEIATRVIQRAEALMRANGHGEFVRAPGDLAGLLRLDFQYFVDKEELEFITEGSTQVFAQK